MQLFTNYRITTLEKEPSKIGETIELLESAFAYDSENSFQSDFYPLLNNSNYQNCHIMVSLTDDKVAAHIGVLMKRLGTKSFMTNVAFIGGIAVRKDQQKLGIFSHLFRYIIKEYEDQASMMLLWSDRLDMYEKFYFYPAIGQIQTGSEPKLGEKVLNEFIKTDFTSISENDLNEIKDIYRKDTSKNYTTTMRTSADWKNIAKIKGADLYVKKIDDKVVSYFIINKGFDLKNIIHEVGFRKSEKQSFINLLKENQVWLPEAENLFTNGHFEKHFMALIKIGDLKRFNRFIKTWSNGEMTVLEISRDSITFRHQGISYTEKLGQFLTFVFGPGPLNEFKKYGPPLYLSGLDSV